MANTSDNESEVSGKIYVHKTSYGLLRVFVGLLGVHHFYVGNTKKGLLTLAITILSFVIMTIGGAMKVPEISLIGFFILTVLNGYLLITAIFIFLKKPNDNGKILISTWK